MKPKIYVIEKGGIGVGNDRILGKGSYSCNTTVGLIGYKKEGKKRFMLVDTGMASSFERIKREIEKRGKLEDVTHILMTHMDQDHPQNNCRFPNAIVICAVGTNKMGTDLFGSIESLYSDGFIENENITYVNVSKTHSRDEMYYIIDSENEGQVIFAGDLIFAPVEEMPAEVSINFDKMVTIDVVRKYMVLKEMYDKYPAVKKIFVGHSGTAITRAGLKKYLEMMKSGVYLDYMDEFVKDIKKKIEMYEKIIQN